MIVGVAPLQPSDPLHVSMHPWTDLILPPFSELSLPASTKIPQTVSSLESKPQLRATRVSPVSTERCNLECCLPSQLHKLYTVIMRCDPKIHIQVSWNMELIHLKRGHQDTQTHEKLFAHFKISMIGQEINTFGFQPCVLDWASDLGARRIFFVGFNLALKWLAQSQKGYKCTGVCFKIVKPLRETRG